MDKNPTIRKCLAVGLIILFVAAGIIPSTALDIEKPFLPTSSGNWLYVGGSGSGNYSTIQSAINDANPGDTVFVYSGTYHQDHIDVNKTICLLGEDMNATIINSTSYGIWIFIDGVEVSNFTIENSSTGIGVGSSNTIIHNCKFRFIQRQGCLVSCGSNHKFINNWIYGWDKGIVLTTNDSKNNILIGNKLMNCSIYMDTEDKDEWNTHFIDNTNTIDGKPVYYYKNQTGGTVPSDAGEIILANCSKISVINQSYPIRIYLGYSSNCSIYNNNINLNSNIESGVVAIYSNDNIFYNNHIFGSLFNNWVDGMRFLSCDKNKIIHNQVSLISNGIILDSCENNYIAQNFITNISRYSILLRSSSNNTIINNNIFGNNEGVMIKLDDSSYNNIKNNDFGNFSTGLTLTNNSCYNIIESNTFSIRDSGIQISGFILLSYNNLIFHNNFLNYNSWNVWCANDHSPNTWYNVTLKEGNYYYDYTGEDNNNDGIGDTPYNIIGGSNQDLYPFMEQNGWLLPPNPNHPPNTPTITGETNGAYHFAYDYFIQTTDPQQDDVKYHLDWGDTTTTTTGFTESGEEIIVSHTWNTKGIYNVMVKAIDVYDAESDWATLTVIMPYSYNIPLFEFWERLLERFPNAFLVLRQLLGY